jgi:hypothetical protein
MDVLSVLLGSRKATVRRAESAICAASSFCLLGVLSRCAQSGMSARPCPAPADVDILVCVSVTNGAGEADIRRK